MDKERVLPKGSRCAVFPKLAPEYRAQLNLSVVTSEYMTSYRYCVVDGQNFGRAYRTKSDAEKGKDNYDAPN